MADLTLSDGREVTFDLYAITRKEYRDLFDPAQTPEDESKVLGKASGLSATDINAMPYGDFRRLAAAFFKKAREPMADPKGSDAAPSLP